MSVLQACFHYNNNEQNTNTWPDNNGKYGNWNTRTKWLQWCYPVIVNQLWTAYIHATRDGSITITFHVIVINYNYFRNCNLIVIETQEWKVIVIVIDLTEKSNYNYMSITFQLLFNYFMIISKFCNWCFELYITVFMDWSWIDNSAYCMYFSCLLWSGQETF